MADPPHTEATPNGTPAFGFIALTVAAAAMLALALFLASHSSTPTVLWVELRTVTADQLNSLDIVLLPPPRGAEAWAVSQAAAEQAVAERHPPTAVKEIVLARVIDRGAATDRVAWVVNLDPAVGLPATQCQSVNDLALAFIDARTGEFLGESGMGHCIRAGVGLPADS